MIKKAQDSMAPWVIGVDIGGTKIILQAVDRQGQARFQEKTRTCVELSELRELIEAFIGRYGIDTEQIGGYGFGIPGIVDVINGVVVDSPALNWHDVPFVDAMKKMLHKPVFIENDVNCAALGEQWLGAARCLQSFVFVAIGTGVGAAIMIDGKLHRGNQNMAGEIGYFISAGEFTETTRYTSEQFGFLDDKISGRAFSIHSLSVDVMLRQYLSGEGEGHRIFTEYLAVLAATLANVSSLLSPQKIVLGGGVASTLVHVLEPLRAQASRLTPVPIAIEISTLGEYTAAYGAARCAWEGLDAITTRREDG